MTAGLWVRAWVSQRLITQTIALRITGAGRGAARQLHAGNPGLNTDAQNGGRDMIHLSMKTGEFSWKNDQKNNQNESQCGVENNVSNEITFVLDLSLTLRGRYDLEVSLTPRVGTCLDEEVGQKWHMVVFAHGSRTFALGCIAAHSYFTVAYFNIICKEGRKGGVNSHFYATNTEPISLYTDKGQHTSY